MLMRWYGHSCFLFESESGSRILIDPCEPKTGYMLSDIRTDAVASSHDHYDHNYFAAAVGTPERITEAGEYRVGDITLTAIPTFHDEDKGAKRGMNLMFLIDIDGIRIAHLGDLGHMLDENAISNMGNVDVLLPPIGGTYTIDYVVARQIANALNVRMVIPMHYRLSEANSKELLPLKPLLDTAVDCSIHMLNQCECNLSKDSIGDNRLLILDPCKPDCGCE